MEDEKLSWSKRSKPTVSCRAWLVHCFLLTLSVLAGALVANTQPRQVVCRPQSYTTPAPSIANTHQYVDHGEKAHAGHDHNHANEDTKVKSKGRLPFELPVFGPDSSSDGKDAQYESVRFVGNPDSQSPYKGPPTAAVDAAWDALWAANMVIPKDMYELSAPEFPNAAVTTNASSVQGPDHYFATFEVTHQLHCLYTLFRASYVDYYEPERRFLMNNPTKYHARLDHCTDILRQKLMWYVVSSLSYIAVVANLKT